MQERRKLERYIVNAPAWITLEEDNEPFDALGANVHNISSKGLYVETPSARFIPDGKNLDVSVLMSVTKISELFGIDEHIVFRVVGRVSRAEPEGKAIEFVRKPSVHSPHYELVRSN